MWKLSHIALSHFLSRWRRGHQICWQVVRVGKGDMGWEGWEGWHGWDICLLSTQASAHPPSPHRADMLGGATCCVILAGHSSAVASQSCSRFVTKWTPTSFTDSSSARPCRLHFWTLYEKAQNLNIIWKGSSGLSYNILRGQACSSHHQIVIWICSDGVFVKLNSNKTNTEAVCCL